MSEKKIGGINVVEMVVGIVLMIVGLLLLGLVFNILAGVIYFDSTLGSGGIFSSADGAFGFSLFAFILFVVGLIITEKVIIENRKT